MIFVILFKNILQNKEQNMSLNIEDKGTVKVVSLVGKLDVNLSFCSFKR